MIPRFIHSGMVGAPAMSTAVSGVLSILNAALVDGFNVTAPVAVSASGGVVTFTYLAAHGYEDKCWVRVSGAGTAALNSDHQCTVPGSLTFTVAVPGIPDGPVSGSISVKVAPLGWDRPYTAPNVAVYRSPNIEGTQLFYQVDDTNPSGQTTTGIVGFESMTSATVGVDRFPLVSQTSIQNRIIKGSGTPWLVIGDDRTVYIYTGSVPQGASYQGVAWFGDFLSDKPADVYAAAVSGNTANATLGQLADCTSNPPGSMVVARSSNALQKSFLAAKVGPVPGQSGRNRPYPNTVSGGLTFSYPILVLDGAGSTIPVRGALRGALFVNEQLSLSAQWMVVPSVTGRSGRVVVVPDGGSVVAFFVDEAW